MLLGYIVGSYPQSTTPIYMSFSCSAYGHSLSLCVYRVWSSRLAYMASLLILLLQRSPLVRVLADGRLLAAPRFANILKFTSVSSAVQVTGTHAVTGATWPEITPVSPSTNPAEAQVGEQFAWVWGAFTPGKKARSYLVDGLPPGITYNNVVSSSSFAAIQGTPTMAGSFMVEITAFHFANLEGEASSVYELLLNVLGGAVTAPVISKSLADQLVKVGESVTLTVEAEGDGLTYAWEKDGVLLPDFDQPQLQLDSVAAADAGTYAVKVFNGDALSTSTAEIKVIAQGIPIPAGQTLYSVSARDNSLRALAADGTTSSAIPITMEGLTVTGGMGLALDPISGQLYVILRLSEPPNDEVGDRVLATLDPSSGQAILVGNPAADQLLKFSDITFDSQGQLYGVTGNDPNAVSPESLFTIDKETAVAMEFLPLGNGDQGEALAYDVERGLLLHASGGPPPETQVLETIDPESKAITPITVQGGWGEGKALFYLGVEQYLVADGDAFYLVTPDGAIVPVGLIDHVTKGLALLPSAVENSFEILRIERTEGGALIEFSAVSGDNYVIESSQDLIEWTERLTGTVPDGETEVVFTDEEATPDLPKRYYRVRQS